MYHLTIVTPENEVFDEDVQSVIAFGGLGYFEVLQNHCAILSTLQSGKLTITKGNGEKHFYYVSGGFFEFLHNRATILADDFTDYKPNMIPPKPMEFV